MTPMNWIAGAGAIALGILVCFFGYRLMRFTLVIGALTLGAYLGFFIATKAGAGFWVVALAAIIMGIIAAVLAGFLFKAAVFLLGAVSGALVSAVFSSWTGWQHLLILALSGLLGGLLALFIQRPALSFLTAFLGAWWMVAGTYNLIGSLLEGARHITRLRLGEGVALPLLALAWLALGVLGFFGQMFKTGKKRKREK